MTSYYEVVFDRVLRKEKGTFIACKPCLPSLPFLWPGIDLFVPIERHESSLASSIPGLKELMTKTKSEYKQENSDK